MARELLTDEERKARRRASQERYRLANMEKCAAAVRASNAKHPERKKAASAKYRAENKDKVRVAARAYTAANAEKINASTMRWRQENRDRFESYQKEYRTKNAGKERARADAWRSANKEKERERLARWATENKDRRCIGEQNRRERKRQGGGKLSVDLAQRLLKAQRGKCACCRTSLEEGYHLDHIMPLALGGPHEDTNIQLLCPPCNLSKNAKHPVEFMQQKGFLL